MNTLQTKALKVLVHTLGRLSDGIHIAREHGFTSGKMVDYVYRNEPSGRLLIGKFLDRIYLSNRGWEAVRIRKMHLEQLLEWTIRRQLGGFGDVFVLDVASGQARYLQETLAKLTGAKVEALCWDLDEKWLEEGQSAAAERGLRGILYDRADALDVRSFGRLPRRPHIVIASGFYEWMEDDRLVKRSLELVYDALCVGGYFLFTMQTGHVDVQMTNAVFAGFDGNPLKLKVRPADQVCRWARAEGFKIVRTMSDTWDYHTVAVARKRRNPLLCSDGRIT